MSRVVKAGMLLLLASVCLMVYQCVRTDNGEFKSWVLGLDRKYYIKDCIVKLNFLWDPNTDRLARQRVLLGIEAPIFQAVVSRELPHFSGGTTRAQDYYVFYFEDRCESRRELVQKLVEEKLVPSIPDFPRYEIEHEGIEPGFDGVTPMGRWLDY